MGIWGVGLYWSDFAMDLRSAIKAVARLPFDNERLVEILSETAPTIADNPHDEDHTTFWLVVADQFAKRAIICDRARKEALTIIDDGSDLAMRAQLGMSPSDLSKRRKMLQDLVPATDTLDSDGPNADTRGVAGDVLWKLERAGTCPPVHFKRMELERIGTLPIDKDKLRRLLPAMPPGTLEAIDDISLANALNVGPSTPAVRRGKPYSTILGIDQVLSS